MTAAMEGMQRLIAEADARFAEKLRMCIAGQPTNLNVYSDRTYNLRHQIAHNPQLTTDAHFMELLGHVEVALAPEYSAQGETDKGLRSLLAGLLKTLLRECVAQPSYSLRKIMVEMVWHWHQDKQREVLDFSLDLQYPGARHSRPSSAAVPQQAAAPKPLPPGELSEEDWARLDAAQAAKAAPRVERRDPTHIAHKLSLFKKRDLAASEQQRQAARQAAEAPSPTVIGLPPAPAPTAAGSGVKVVYTKGAQERQRLLQQHTEAHNGPAGPEVLVHQSSIAPFFNKRPHTAFALMSGGERGVALTAQPTDIALARAEGRIMSHLARRMEGDQHERERGAMLSMLAHNQARLEEESARRVESQGAAAQTGRACHFILTKDAAAKRYIRGSNGHDAEGGDSEANVTFSPFDYDTVDTRVPALTGELSGAADGASAARAGRMGLAPPPSRGVADDGLDVVMTADCCITPSTIRLDRPMHAQILAAVPQPSSAPGAKPAPPPPYNPSDVPMVTRERLAELAMVERVRNAFAENGAKGAHCPYRAAFKSVVRPTDASLDECLSLLPMPGGAFPSNPFPAESKKKKGAAKKK